jgi:hypothetical protein
MDTQFISELAARIPYGIVCEMGPKNDIKIVEKLNLGGLDQLIRGNWEIKPYLFPLSSMTEEEKKEFIHCAEYEVEESVNGRHYEYYLKDYVGTPENPICNCNAINWLNKNHFDYNDWIGKGLAIDATEKNIY